MNLYSHLFIFLGLCRNKAVFFKRRVCWGTSAATRKSSSNILHVDCDISKVAASRRHSIQAQRSRWFGKKFEHTILKQLSHKNELKAWFKSLDFGFCENYLDVCLSCECISILAYIFRKFKYCKSLPKLITCLDCFHI